MVVHSQPVVPMELIHEIFSSLWSQGDLSSLKACSLVRRSWLPVARLLIFRSVKFEQPKWVKFNDAIDSFIGAVRNDPGLIRNIRDLSFNFSLSSHNFFERITFSSLESFTVKHISMIWFDDFKWSLLKMPNLTKIVLVEDNFANLDQFSRFFDQEHGINITTVQLHRVCILKEKLTLTEREREYFLNPNREEDLKDEDIPPLSTTSSTPQIRPKLQTLEIVRGHASFLASWFIKEECPFDLTALKTLKYEEDFVQPDVTNLVELLKICAMSLENLEIYSPSKALKTNDLDISTSTMPNLKRLTISGISPCSIVNAIPWLSHLTSDSLLHTLVLKFSFGNLKLAANINPWQTLDDAIDNLPILNLERIEVKIPDRKQKKSVQEISKAYLPKVMGRSISVLTIL